MFQIGDGFATITKRCRRKIDVVFRLRNEKPITLFQTMRAFLLGAVHRMTQAAFCLDMSDGNFKRYDQNIIGHSTFLKWVYDNIYYEKGVYRKIFWRWEATTEDCRRTVKFIMCVLCNDTETSDYTAFLSAGEIKNLSLMYAGRYRKTPREEAERLCSWRLGIDPICLVDTSGGVCKAKWWCRIITFIGLRRDKKMAYPSAELALFTTSGCPAPEEAYPQGMNSNGSNSCGGAAGASSS